jgi:hypothetical protein
MNSERAENILFLPHRRRVLYLLDVLTAYAFAAKYIEQNGDRTNLTLSTRPDRFPAHVCHVCVDTTLLHGLSRQERRLVMPTK